MGAHWRMSKTGFRGLWMVAVVLCQIGRAEGQVTPPASFESVYELADYQASLSTADRTAFRGAYINKDVPEEAPEWLKAKLPQPILDAHPEWIKTYWMGWRCASINVFKRNDTQTFMPEYYMDEVYNGNTFMWDTAFMIMWARWAWYMWPSIQSFNTFYNKQCRVLDGTQSCDQDYFKGFIPREIFNDGTRCSATACASQTNPPLFAWVEWEHFGFTADTSRLAYALPIILDQYKYIEGRKTMMYVDGPNAGLFRTGSLASGMDGTPRMGGSNWDQLKGAWICMSAQMALNAQHICKIATVLGETETIRTYQEKYDVLKKLINEKLWDTSRGFYDDRLESPNNFSGVETNASLWPLLAKISSEEQAKSMVSKYILNPKKFWTTHPFPTVAVDHATYDAKYWSGGVWAGLNYMVVRGLDSYGYESVAQEATRRHLVHLTQTARYPFAEWWSPTSSTRAGVMVGWSALGAISQLIENEIGIKNVNAPAKTLDWRIIHLSKNGIRNLHFGTVVADLICAPRTDSTQVPNLTVTTNEAFTLNAMFRGKTYTMEFPKGTTQRDLGGGVGADPLRRQFRSVQRSQSTPRLRISNGGLTAVRGHSSYTITGRHIGGPAAAAWPTRPSW